MEVRRILPDRTEVVPADRLAEVLADPEAIVWVDIPNCDEDSITALLEVFEFHPVAVQECINRQRMPKVHLYSDHLFLVLHSPERGERGHVHYVELDQFVAARRLVTVHGPTNPAVPEQVPLRHTAAVWQRIAAGRFHPRTALEISHAIVSDMALAMEATIEDVTASVWSLEQQVTQGQLGDPEAFLDEMFRTRHALLAVGNVSGTGLEVYERILRIAHDLGPGQRRLLVDSADQLRRVQGLATSQRDYLQGVIEFYRTRTDTKMAIAAERLAVIAVVTLPITALASVLGMNVIVNEATDFPLLAVALGIMLAMSLYLLRWAKRHGWW